MTKDITEEELKQYYSIELDKSEKAPTQTENKQSYVKFNTLGLKRILDHYNKIKNKNLKISIEEFVNEKNITKEEDIFEEIHCNQSAFEKTIKSLNETFENLENKEVAGLIFLLKQKDGFMHHAIPYLVAKGENGEKILILFEDLKAENESEKESKKQTLLENGFTIKKVPNYSSYINNNSLRIQNDHHSCATFSMNTLKNCLQNNKFLKSCISAEAEIEQISGRMGQNSSFAKDFKPAYLARKEGEKLVLDEKGKINLKAWYKSHNYAQKINLKHLENLPDYDKKLIAEIDAKRKKIKDAKQREQTTPATTASNIKASSLIEMAQKEITEIKDILSAHKDNPEKISTEINKHVATKTGDDFFRPNYYCGLGIESVMETKGGEFTLKIKQIFPGSIAESLGLKIDTTLKFTKTTSGDISEDEKKAIITSIRNLDFNIAGFKFEYSENEKMPSLLALKDSKTEHKNFIAKGEKDMFQGQNFDNFVKLIESKTTKHSTALEK